MMKISADNADLPPEIKEKVVEELRKLQLVLDDNKPIEKSVFEYIYRTRSTVKEELSACKVIVIPEDFSLKAKGELMKSAQNEVIMSYNV